MNYTSSLAILLQVLEGGYSDNPADPGGATNFGVTQRALDAARATHPEWNLPAAVQDLTAGAVAPFYETDYWRAVQGDNLPQPIGDVLFWQAVNQGVPAVTACVQQLLGLHIDCQFGPVTASAVARQDPTDFVARFLAATAVNYTRSSNWPTFGAGWMRRVLLEALYSQR